MLRKTNKYLKDKASNLGSKYSEKIKNQKKEQDSWKKKESNFSNHQMSNRKMFNDQQKQRLKHFKKKEKEHYDSFQKKNNPVDEKKTALATIGTVGAVKAISSALKMKRHLNKSNADQIKPITNNLGTDKPISSAVKHVPGAIEKYGPSLGIAAGAIGAGLVAKKYLKSQKNKPKNTYW